jgi:hypothetical protein
MHPAPKKMVLGKKIRNQAAKGLTLKNSQVSKKQICSGEPSTPAYPENMAKTK